MPRIQYFINPGKILKLVYCQHDRRKCSLTSGSPANIQEASATSETDRIINMTLWQLLLGFGLVLDLLCRR
jgi:hypothetical protein